MSHFTMVPKPLPKELVERLRKIVRHELDASRADRRRRLRIAKVLGGMENIDPRKADPREDEAGNMEPPIQPDDTKKWGGRIRRMNVSRNYPGVELVIKRAHDASAEETIRIIQQRVREHNREKPENYRLIKPDAHAIGPGLIAMSRIDAPALDEIFQNPEIRHPTVRQQRLERFRELQEAHAFTEAEFRRAMEEVCGGMKLKMENILFLGVKNGRFIFMPLLDLF